MNAAPESPLTPNNFRPAFREMMAVFRRRRFWFEDPRTPSNQEKVVAELFAVARVVHNTTRRQ
jgi:hypothetical protein